MLQRLRSKKQPYTLSSHVLSPQILFGLRPIVSPYRFVMMLLLSAGFVMPNAQAASCKLPKSYYKNVSCTASSSYFLAIKDFGAPVALLDKNGKSVVDLSRYQKVDADKLSNGLLPVLRNNRIGYLNMQGREVIPATYDVLTESQGWARPVVDGRIVVKKDGNYGVITTANKVIVPFSSANDDIDNYRNGTARIRKNRTTSWVDKNGNTVDDPDSQNIAPTTNPSSASRNTNSASASASKPEVTRFTTLQARQQDGKWGFVDDNNVTMITYSFDEVRPFSEEYAGVRIGEEWGFVNLGGELVIPFRFGNSGISDKGLYQGKPSFTFVAGKAWIGNLKNGDKMCINKEGNGVGCD